MVGAFRCNWKLGARFDSWFLSPVLDSLEELEFVGGRPPRTLPPSVVRFASTLRYASIAGCYFPRVEGASLLILPRLKHLVLYDVAISRTDVEQLHRACAVLEALQLEGVYGFTSLRIASTNLRTIGLSSWWNGRELEVFHDLFIESAPLLDRLIVLEPAGPTRISIVHAPRLAVLGYASTQCSEIGVGHVVVQVKLA